MVRTPIYRRLAWSMKDKIFYRTPAVISHHDFKYMEPEGLQSLEAFVRPNGELMLNVCFADGCSIVVIPRDAAMSFATWLSERVAKGEEHR